MRIDWSDLRRELAIWRAEERVLPIWWRDDDAVQASPALNQLTKLSEELDVPLHLAVIPAHADATLADAVADRALVVPMVHGWAHENHAPAGSKKAEFGQPRTEAAAELGLGLSRIRALFPTASVEYFVPPWNRMEATLISALPAAGYAGVSTFTPRNATKPVPGLTQINTHLDPIHWRGGGGLIPPGHLVAGLVQTLQDRRSGIIDAAEPLGILTHHLVHDADIWDFTRAVLSECLDGGAVAVRVSAAI